MFGADLKVHRTFMVLVPMLALRDWWQTGSGTAVGYTMALIGVLFVSVLLHELGHLSAGLRAGGFADQILIWPLGGLTETTGVPPFPKPQIWMALSGPLVNLALAAAAFASMAAVGIGPLESAARFLAPIETRVFATWLLTAAFFVNLFGFAFNMLPALPLDGGSMLRWSLLALFPAKGYPWATFGAVKAGKVTAVLTGVAGIALYDHGWAFLLVVFAIMSYLFCEREKKMLEYEMIESAAYDGFEQDEGEGFDQDIEEPQAPKPGYIERWREKRRMRKREREVMMEVEMRQRVDALLDKISRDGIGSLSEKEKAFLKEASKRYQKNGAAQ